MMKKMMSKTISKTKVNKRTVVIATAITTLLSATAVIAIKAFRKSKKENKSEVEIVLDGLVEDGTITQAQQIAIQSAIITANEAKIANDDLMRVENFEVETVPGSSKTDTITKLTSSLFKGPQTKNL
ncbi:hypothetical protein E4K67_20675 [Desulfosporosinus fructosivorans]|uniref:Uncharacterized protein n=1 Tax=Desulfosporosinus fructosivorans TaxID=2018669 RepID=A0A4Z0R402_9FIRM|nr:hypothetical protein [Desulfosporosinus fructosivorans]TGE36346.1 hypothetical protein E4K67_20675 [Desulfosporosinus fructosivorans]